MAPFSKITPDNHHNYVAFFLTLACNLHCPYCINSHNIANKAAQTTRFQMSVDEWIAAANRLCLRADLPLTLQGGEPTLHHGFFRIVNEVNPEIKMDLMTNLMFDVDRFIANVPVWRFTRDAPYAAIRASYHPGQNRIYDLVAKAEKLQDAGFRIGLYCIEHPDQEIHRHVMEVREHCLRLGLDFRLKEFLGQYNGKIYGTFKYGDSVCGETLKRCMCRTTEIIVDPSGQVFKCHSDLYQGRNPIAHILDEQFSEQSIDEFRECDYYGNCNPCDVKVKTDRFQVFGHTSIEVRDLE